MPPSDPPRTFADGSAYERQMGQWSHAIARQFLDWLDLPAGLRWLDVGCGTGAVCSAILGQCRPEEVIGIDPSAAQIAFARSRIADGRARFVAGDGQSLGFGDDRFDVAIAALLLNLAPDTPKVVSEMCRVVRPRGCVAAYVWDTTGGGHLLRPLTLALKSVLPSAPSRSGGAGRAVRGKDDLMAVFAEARLSALEMRDFEVLVRYPSADDFWQAVIGGQGKQGRRIRELGAADLERFRETLFDIVPPAGDGTVSYPARVCAIRGQVPEA